MFNVSPFPSTRQEAFPGSSFFGRVSQHSVHRLNYLKDRWRSCSSEACQNHQKRNSFTPFPSSLPNPRNLSHKSSFIPKTCNLWTVLPSFFPESYNLPSFKSKTNKLNLISLVLAVAFFFRSLLGLCIGRDGLFPT